jgi:hypothetical protein
MHASQPRWLNDTVGILLQQYRGAEPTHLRTSLKPNPPRSVCVVIVGEHPVVRRGCGEPLDSLVEVVNGWLATDRRGPLTPPGRARG